MRQRSTPSPTLPPASRPGQAERRIRPYHVVLPWGRDPERDDMSHSMPFDTPKLLIGGRRRDASGGRTLMLYDPSDGSELAPIARGTAADVDAAVIAAQAALDGDWGRLSAAERGRILAAIGREVLDSVEMLAQLEARDVGKPLKQGRADAVALARYFEFYAGAADKVHGETLPFETGYTRADPARAAWRDRAHRAVELPDADRRPECRRGSDDGQCVCAQASRSSLPHGARVRAHRARGGPARGCPERGAGARRRGRCGAVVAPRHPAHLVHRFGPPAC